LDPVLIERNPEEVEHARTNGVFVEGVSGDRNVRPRIYNEDAGIGGIDLVIVLVKSYDTKGACSTIQKILSEDGSILTIQNGVGNFEILNEEFPGRVLAGVTTMGAMTIARGRVRHTGFGPTHLGEANGEISERVIAIRDALRLMNGGPVHESDNPFGLMWSKLIINASINAPATLLRLRNGDLPATESGRQLITRIVHESVDLVEAKGIKLIFQDPESEVLKVCKGTSGNLNSMLQDILAGRRTEIDFINGAIAVHARSLGLKAPVNETLTMLIRSLEATGDVRLPNEL
jgi:2-dehydropantoate 2-reductase